MAWRSRNLITALAVMGTMAGSATVASQYSEEMSDATGAPSRKEEAMIEARVQPADRNLEVNGLRLHLREWGEADAPPVVILHGITGHAWEFDRLADHLAGTYHVLVINQRGHGASDRADTYSPAVMAHDVVALLDQLGLDRVRVVGHSMGGINGLWLAARHPERVERLAVLDIDVGTVTAPELFERMAGALEWYASARFDRPEAGVAIDMAGYEGPAVDALWQRWRSCSRFSPPGGRDPVRESDLGHANSCIVTSTHVGGSRVPAHPATFSSG